MEAQLGAALLQFGASGVLATALVSLFLRLIAAYERHITYVVNQNAILREEVRMLLRIVLSPVEERKNLLDRFASGVLTNLDEPDVTKK